MTQIKSLDTGAKRSKFQPGQDLGRSPWMNFSQSDIDVFASVTRDVTQLHNDPEWAANEGPFGHTIAIGFHTLSMLTHFMRQIVGPKDYKVALNYGLNRVRFLAPIPVNADLRAHIVVKDVEARPDGAFLNTFDVTVEIRDHDKPALKAEWLSLITFD